MRKVIPWWSTEFGVAEAAAVTAAIRDRCISQGRITRQFEEALAETLRVPYVVCTTSGTTALTMALMACGVGAGDEVIVPDKTWIATAHAVMMAGANARLIDTWSTKPIGDFSRAPQDAKAWVPVHLNGRMVRLEIRGAAPRPFVVDDACQAFPQPPVGDIACYSLSTAKIIATGQGGFCATRSEALYRELKSLRTHDVADAMVPEVLAWRRFGYNFRFTDIQAAIGLEQLKRLPERIAWLREINNIYRRNLPESGASLSMLSHGPDEIPLYNEILLPDLESQENLRARLLELGVETRPFYPLLHTAPYLKSPGAFPNAQRFAHGLVLPSGPSQRRTDILIVCDAIAKAQLPA